MLADNRFLTPWPLGDGAPSPSGLSVSGKIETPSGWLDLNDGVGYSFEGTSFADRQVTWRRQEVTSPFVEGTYIVGAVRENITEAVSVWVRGETFSELDARVEALIGALGQMTYRFMLRLEDSAHYWTCWPADYTVSGQREYLHSRLVLVKATMPRLPGEQVVLASGDEL